MAQDELNPVEYAKQICRDLAWPTSGNAALISDCITAIAFQQKISVEEAFTHLVMKIKLAKRLGIKVNRWFFQDGKYNDIKTEHLPKFKTNKRPAKKLEQRESEGNGV